MVICGVVGARNGGKTSLAELLTRALTAEGVSVAYLKRASRGFEVDREHKDTGRLTEAGAVAVAAVGGGRAFLLEPADDDPGPLLERLAGYDLVLAEGWHDAPWPKIRVTAVGAEPRAAAPEVIAEVAAGEGGAIDAAELRRALDAVRSLLGLAG